MADSYSTSGSSPTKTGKKANRNTSSVDLIFENHFSIFLIRPVSDAGQAWLDENVGDENTQVFGNAIVCEPRYAPAIAEGAIQAGLAVQ